MTLTRATYADRSAAYGHSPAAKLYGNDGDRCQYPTCNVLLSEYNDRDICCCHPASGKKRTPRKRGEPRSAGGSAVTTAAEAPRRVSREEIDMAAEQRRKAGETKANIVEYLRDRDDWVGCSEIAATLGIATSSATTHLQDLAGMGKLERKVLPHGGHHYRLRQDVAAKAAETPRDRYVDESSGLDFPLDRITPPTEDAPAAHTGAAPATEGITPEQPAGAPADPAAPDPLPPQEPPAAGPPPFVGIADELAHLHLGVPATVIVDFDIDEIVERVMARIAERMTRQERYR